MAEYIERKTALTIIDNYGKTVDSKGKIVVNAIRDMFSVILPTEDVAPVKHGKWIYVRSHYEADECKCSLCNQIMTTHKDERMDYCPKCGAKMDGDTNG